MPAFLGFCALSDFVRLWNAVYPARSCDRYGSHSARKAGNISQFPRRKLFRRFLEAQNLTNGGAAENIARAVRGDAVGTLVKE